MTCNTKILKKNSKLFSSFFISATILFLLFRNISLPEVADFIKKCDTKLVFLTVLISSVSNFIVCAYRWKLILMHLSFYISLQESLLIKLGSDPIISFFPFKTGEVFKLIYLKKIKEIPYFTSIASVISEYLLNIFVLFMFIVTGTIIYLNNKNNFNFSSQLLLLFLCSSSFPVIGKSIAMNLRNKLIYYYSLIKLNFKELKSIFLSKSIILYSALYMFAELINIFLLTRAFSISIPFHRILIFAPLIILLSSLPITILGIGVRESAILFFFFQFASAEALLSVGIMYSFVEHIFPTLIGACFAGIFLSKLFYKKIELS